MEVMIMDVIPGIFGEKEFAAMDDNTIRVLGTLLDDKVALVLKNYLDNPEADKEIVDRVSLLIGDKIAKCTFHMEVIDSGVIDLLKSLSYQSLAYGDLNYDYIIQQLEFLEENKHKLKGYIEPRESKNFAEFLKCMKDLSTTMIGKPKDYDNLTARVKANKEFFCSAHERNRPTRIGIAISKTNEWEIELQGARYLKYCNENNITGWMRREF